MVSVIIPTWNRAKTIKKAIESVLLQGDIIGEIIIIDDCSTDNTFEIINKISSKKIKYYRMVKNSGPAIARNEGIEKAKFKYIAFHDSDDIWYENKIKYQLKLLKEKKLDIIASGYTQNKFGEETYIGRKEYIGYQKMHNELLKGNFVGTPTLIGKVECFKKEKFDINLAKLEDWELAIRLAKEYKFEFINESLVEAIIQENSVTLDFDKQILAFEQIYSKHEKDIKLNNDAEEMFNRKLGLFYLQKNEFKEKHFKIAYKMKKNGKNYIDYFGGKYLGYKFLKKIHGYR